MTDVLADHVLITGSNRGIGLEMVRQMHDRVDTLYATCRRPDGATELQALAEAHPQTIRVLPLDVTDTESIDVAHKLVKTDGGAIDLLINNAGVDGGGTSDRFGSVDAASMTHTLQVNTVGPHIMVQTFADLLREGASRSSAVPARVVNVTSQLGSIANTNGGTWQSYKASKAALNMCTRLQHGALKSDGVCVVSMHPGWVQTDMGGSGARLTPEESVSGMIDVIDALTLDDGGRFLTHAGDELPW
jgi:NAD(P)-dependent dehydrogenase (short-subunit alcohol dehydrogenase family)